MIQPPHYASKWLDTDQNFRKVLKFINTHSGGKTYGSCAGHSQHTYEKSPSKLCPILNVRFPKRYFDNADALITVFQSNGWLRAYTVELMHPFLDKKFPGSTGLVLYLTYDVKDNWDKVLAALEETIKEDEPKVHVPKPEFFKLIDDIEAAKDIGEIVACPNRQKTEIY